MRPFVLMVSVIGIFAVACGGAGPSAGHPSTLAIPCTNDATKQAAIDTNVRNETAIPIETQLALSGSVTPVPFLLPDDEATCKIRKVLLATEDLQGGWRLSEFPSTSYGADRIYPDASGTCGVPYTYLVAGPHIFFDKGARETATVPTTKEPIPTNQPIPEGLDDVVLVFNHGTASEVMSAIRRSCRFAPTTPPASDATAESSSTASHLISFPSIGDDTIAFGAEIAGTAEFRVLARRGDVIEDISLIGSGASAPELEAIAKIADAKIAAQGDYLQPTETGVTPTPTLPTGSREAILGSALLTADELPRGWIPGHSNAEFDMTTLHFCSYAPVLPRRVRGASASYSGSAPGAGDALGIGVLSYDLQDADKIMRAVTDGSAFPDGCSGSVRNIAVTWSIKPLAIPALGDSSAGWQAIARHTAASGPPDSPLVSDIELDFEVFRRANLIALVIEHRQAPRSDGPSFLDDIMKSELGAFSAIVDTKLKAIQGKVPPG